MSAGYSNSAEYGSGEVVEPGQYIDVESGAIVHVHERDELPVGSRVVVFRRTFRRLDEEPTNGIRRVSAA